MNDRKQKQKLNIQGSIIAKLQKDPEVSRILDRLKKIGDAVEGCSEIMKSLRIDPGLPDIKGVQIHFDILRKYVSNSIIRTHHFLSHENLEVETYIGQHHINADQEILGVNTKHPDFIPWDANALIIPLAQTRIYISAFVQSIGRLCSNLEPHKPDSKEVSFADRYGKAHTWFETGKDYHSPPISNEDRMHISDYTDHLFVKVIPVLQSLDRELGGFIQDMSNPAYTKKYESFIEAIAEVLYLKANAIKNKDDVLAYCAWLGHRLGKDFTPVDMFGRLIPPKEEGFER